MQEKRLEMAGMSFSYRETGGRATILGIEGSAPHLKVPGAIDGCPVTAIEKKAFFDCRNLRTAVLPDSLEELGSWAFAHCMRLERVELPWKALRMGKDPFIGSQKLERIDLRKEGAERADCPVAPLLASAAVRMEDPHLFSIEEAGNAEWLKRWDARMLVILREPDVNGFEKNVLTGEEDYASTDLERFVHEKRRAKVRLAFLRLLCPEGLQDGVRRELETYLQAHTRGCPSQETWQVLLEEYGDRKDYYEKFARLGCLTIENFDGILQDMKGRYPEMKAYFMRYKEENLGGSDFFASLSLDLI